MEYNGMKRNEMEYNNVPLFGFEKMLMEWSGTK
jgi:hypothetical protein